MAKKTDDVLNLKQAATVAGELLGERVSLYKLKKWIRFGALPIAVQTPRLRLFRRIDVERVAKKFAARRRSTGAGEAA